MTKNNTREDLLQKGFDLFHIKGYNGTGIGEITGAVKVSKGSFYNHFKKKESFVIEMLDNFGEILATEHQQILSNPKLKPLERVKQFYESKTKSVIQVTQFKKGCIISNMCQEVADNSELVAKSVDQAFEGMRIALSNCLEEAKTLGSIDTDEDTELLAEFILNSWNGALMRVKASRNSKALDAFLRYLNSIGN